MKKLNHLWWVGALAIVVACDPYKNPNKGVPVVEMVLASGGTPADVATSVVEATAPAVADGAWTLETSSTCVASTTVATVKVTDRVLPTEFILFIRANKLLDGASIQANASSCVPAIAAFDVVQTATDGSSANDTASWYACYQPAAALDSEGGSVVLYRSAARTATAANGDVTIDGGWFAMSNEATGAKEDYTPYVQGSPKEIVTYTFSGSVKDEQGQPLPFKVAYSIAPDAGALTFDLTTPPLTLTLTNPPAGGSATKTISDPILGTSTAITATGAPPTTADVTFDFAEGECNPASGATYRVERSPSGAKTFTAIAAANQPAAGATSFTDTGLVYGDSYDYRLIETITPTGGTALETVKGTRTMTALLSPAAPKSLTATTSSVTVAWDAVPGATSYTVERNVSDEATYTVPVPGTVWTPVGDATDTTLTDSGRPGATPYWYRVTANNANGSSEPGPAARVVTQ